MIALTPPIRLLENCLRRIVSHIATSGELGATIAGMWTLYASLMFISVISPNRLPSLGQIGAFYFESTDESQVWINIEPQNSVPGPTPINLNFTMAFPGHEIERAPDMVEVRAESYNIAFPQIARQPILRFKFEDGGEMDLTAPGKTFQFTYHGLCSVDESCSPDTVIARMLFSDLCKIAASHSLKIEAVGFTLNMKPEDIQSLRRYVQTMQNGVRLSPAQYGKLNDSDIHSCPETGILDNERLHQVTSATGLRDKSALRPALSTHRASSCLNPPSLGFHTPWG